MSSRLELAGQKFGRLTAKEISGKTKWGRIKWWCVCDCGNTVEVSSADLQKGSTGSCGCLARELSSINKIIDLTGQVVGKLTVEGIVEKTKLGKECSDRKWRCKC